MTDWSSSSAIWFQHGSACSGPLPYDSTSKYFTTLDLMSADVNFATPLNRRCVGRTHQNLDHSCQPTCENKVRGVLAIQSCPSDCDLFISIVASGLITMMTISHEHREILRWLRATWLMTLMSVIGHIVTSHLGDQSQPSLVGPRQTLQSCRKSCSLVWIQTEDLRKVRFARSGQLQPIIFGFGMSLLVGINVALTKPL